MNWTSLKIYENYKTKLCLDEEFNFGYMRFLYTNSTTSLFFSVSFYFQGNENRKEVSRKSHNYKKPAEKKASPVQSAEWEEDLNSTVCQIPCYYGKPAKTGDRSNWYQDKKAPYHARRVPPEVQRPETEEKKEHKKLKKYQGLKEELENTYIYLYIIFFLSQPGTRGQ